MNVTPPIARRIAQPLVWMLILLSLLIGVWWWARARDDSPGQVAGSMPPGATLGSAQPRAALREIAPPPATTDPTLSASSKSADPEPAPSAECVAARRLDADEESRLKALTSAERDAVVESAARAAHEEERVVVRTLISCEGLADAAAMRCMVANGLARVGEVFPLYRHEQAIERAFLRHASRVVARGDARSLLAAAHILPFAESSTWSDETPLERRPEAVEWIVRAQRLGRNDPVVQWGS